MVEERRSGIGLEICVRASLRACVGGERQAAAKPRGARAPATRGREDATSEANKMPTKIFGAARSEAGGANNACGEMGEECG